MPSMRAPLRFLSALVLTTLAGPAPAATLADISIHDRRDGQALRIHHHEGRRYVVGTPGAEYEIRVRNRGAQRVLAVTSVDGVNVLSGATASATQSGYVLDPYAQTRIDGWRKNLSEVASFTFTRLPDSYAARTGRPDHVGVIGVALFRERIVPPPCCTPWRDEALTEEDARAGTESSGAPSSAAADVANPAPRSVAPQKKSERLGTGHGRRLDSRAYEVAFERASETPDEVMEIHYDSRANLVAQGVIPAPRRLARRMPDAFPADARFVPDP
jgi:hypothetical protein